MAFFGQPIDNSEIIGKPSSQTFFKRKNANGKSFTIMVVKVKKENWVTECFPLIISTIE